MKGYKVFNRDWTCRGYQYEVGGEFFQREEPVICERGFHFCETLIQCYNYYPFDPENKIAEVEAIGKIDSGEGKHCTDRIRILSEVSWDKVLLMVNIGQGCTGLGNVGDGNSGCWNTGTSNSGSLNAGGRNRGDSNTGDHNSGDRNTGDSNRGSLNSGYHNSGNENTGAFNSGNRNTDRFNIGDCNSGSKNIGERNTGTGNSGDWNAGSFNLGHRNSGDFNKGDHNAGDWNKSSWSAGCFNVENRKLFFFDKESEMTMEEWRGSRAYRLLRWAFDAPVIFINYSLMSDEEKAENPYALDVGGYLKKVDPTKNLQAWWQALGEEDRQEIFSIPNFDAEKFKITTGIDVTAE